MSSQITSQPSLLSQAKRGDPSAIATLLSNSLSAKGITVNVNRIGGCLEFWLDAQSPPEQQTISNHIQRGFEKLQAEGIYLVIVHGRRTGSATPTWTQTIPLQSSVLPVIEEDGTSSTPDASFLAPMLPSSATVVSATNAPAPLIEAWLDQGVAPIPPQPHEDNLSPERQIVRLLRFQLRAEESVLLPLSVIRQVLTIPAAEILPVPQMPACVLGVYNHRGEILWMVHLATQIGLPAGVREPMTRATPQSSLTAIVIQFNGATLGLVVPAIFDIEEYPQIQIQPPMPGLLSHQLLPFVSGCLLESRRVVLDASALLYDSQLQVHSLHT